MGSVGDIVSLSMQSSQTLLSPSTLNAMKARRQFGEVLDKTYYQGRSFLIERAGKPVAAIIPIRLYEAIQSESRQHFSAFMTQTRAEFSALSTSEQDTLIDEAVTFAKSSQSL